jgi:hypothetical protein
MAQTRLEDVERWTGIGRAARLPKCRPWAELDDAVHLRLQRLQYGIPHCAGADALAAGFPDVARAQSTLQDFLDGVLNPRGLFGAVEWIDDALAGNVRRRAA